MNENLQDLQDTAEDLQVIPSVPVDNQENQIDYTLILQDINTQLENITNLLQEQNNVNNNDSNNILSLLKSINTSISENSIEFSEIEVEDTVSVNSIIDTPLNNYTISESLSFLTLGLLLLGFACIIFFDRRF